MADRMFDWNDVINGNDAAGFALLPEGRYPFTVVGFERGEHAGSDGIPPCKKAVLTIELDGGALGTTQIKENLFLHSRQKWKLSQFFIAIGYLKKDEEKPMDWNRVPGAKGWAEVIINEYDEKKNGQKTGNKRKNNRIDRYLDPAEVRPAQAPAAAPAAGGGFVPGAF